MGESPDRDIPSLAGAESIVRREISQCNSEKECDAQDFLSSVFSLLEDNLKRYSSRHRYRHRYSRSRGEYKSDKRPRRGRRRSQSNSGRSSSCRKCGRRGRRRSQSNSIRSSSCRRRSRNRRRRSQSNCHRSSSCGRRSRRGRRRSQSKSCRSSSYRRHSRRGRRRSQSNSRRSSSCRRHSRRGRRRSQSNSRRSSSCKRRSRRGRRRSYNTHIRSHNTRHSNTRRYNSSRSHNSSSSRSHSSSRYNSSNSKSYERSKVDRAPKYSSDGGSNTTPYSPGSKRRRDSNTPSSYSHSVSQGRRHNRDRNRGKYEHYKRPRVYNPGSLHSPQGPSNSGGRKTSLLSSCGNLSTRSGAACDSPIGSFSREHPGKVMAKDFVPYGSNDELPSVSEASVREMKVASNSITLKHREAKGGAREGNALMDSDLVVSGQSKGREGKGTSNKQASAEGPEVPSVSQDSTYPLEGHSSGRNYSETHRKRSKKRKHSAKDKMDEPKAKERTSSSSKEQWGGKRSSHTEQQEKATHSPTVVASSSSAKGEYRRAYNLQVQTETALGEQERALFKVPQAKDIGGTVKSQAEKHFLLEPIVKTEMGLTEELTAEDVMLDCDIKEEYISDGSYEDSDSFTDEQ